MNRLRSLGFVAALLAVATVSASAITFTGNPATDGWTLHGNSLSLGTYIRGAGDYGFDTYSTGFTLSASDPLFNGTSWLAGDQILALGGVMNPVEFVVARLVGKFGASTAAFSPSSLASPFGDGDGSFSGGDGGLGSVQVDYLYQFSIIGGFSKLNAGQDVTILTPDTVRYFNGASVNINADYGRVLSDFQITAGSDLLLSFEVFLNLSALGDPARGNLGSVVPAINGKADMALQNELDVNIWTDAYIGQIVPEPSTAGLVALAGFGLLALRKRRR